MGHISRIIILMLICISGTSCDNGKSQQIEQLRLENERLMRIQEEQRLEKERNVNCINTVLQRDARNYNLNKNNLTVMSRKMRSIDLTGCPRDFAAAYIDHIHAWENYDKAVKARKELMEYGDAAAVAGLIATIAEAEASPFSDYLEAEKEANKLVDKTYLEISTTWQRIEHLTVEYGGQLPK